MNGTIQKKKVSLSDFQGLLSVFIYLFIYLLTIF